MIGPERGPLCAAVVLEVGAKVVVIVPGPTFGYESLKAAYKASGGFCDVRLNIGLMCQYMRIDELDYTDVTYRLRNIRPIKHSWTF